MIYLSNKKNIHFVGIKGAGMAALAVVAKEWGFSVTGTDVAEVFVTDRLLAAAGITVARGFNTTHIGELHGAKKSILVVATAGHSGLGNEEAVYAKKLGIDVLTYGAALGLFMKGKKGISVAGCHGKTTTAGMISHILMKARVDPSFVVGCGGITSLGTAGHGGSGAYFVAEADEYAADPTYDTTPKLLYQHPAIAVITNIDFDHPDVFSSLHQIQDVFVQFTNGVASGGTVIAAIDNAPLRSILPLIRREKITYGFANDADCFIGSTATANGTLSFQLQLKSRDLGMFTLHIPGRQNVLNATAAILAAHTAGVSIDVIRDALTSFSGTKRRFEFVGITQKGARLYDDYAHHPTEIEATIKAGRDWFPGKRMIGLFQPHTYSRTKALLTDFAKSLSLFDTAIIVDIFPSAREKKDSTIHALQVAALAQKINTAVQYGGSLSEAVKMLAQTIQKDDVIFTMGAGDLFNVHSAIIQTC